jgi:hypothetical protein
MKLIITDKGDPSVGIFECQYSIECPFNKDEIEKADLEMFRQEMINIYADYSQMKIYADYDFELESLKE